MSTLKRAQSAWLAGLAAILALTATLRLLELDGRVLSNDEAYSWRITQYSWPEILYRSRWDANPPLYYLVLQSWEALWGDSPWALRGLSVLLAVLSVPLTCAACQEALRLQRVFGKASPERPSAATLLGSVAKPLPAQGLSFGERGGALFAGFLLAVHAAQVGPGRTARMYALGVFLAALTSWLLLKGLRQQRRPLVWWTAYGLAAAFALTHYYACFALAAQGLFAAAFVVWQLRQSGWRGARERAGWLAFAVVLAGLVYAPWLPSLWGQIRDVREGFWIADVQADEAARVFWPWYTGASSLGSWEKISWLGVLALCISWTIYRRDTAGWFFLLQAAVPWLGSIALSLLWQRSIFYNRYLVFAQWGLLGWWGIVSGRFPSAAARWLIGLFVGVYAIAGVAWRSPTAPVALAQAAEYLKAQARPGDEVWVASAAEVNRLRYYAARVGATVLRVRCPLPLGEKGHVVHVASLSGEDVQEADALANPPARYWWAGPAVSHAGAGSRAVLEADFHDGLEHYHLVLYEREKSAR